jgi:cyclophilin family peptidyl-prolyl cis-trans isomerase
MKTRAFLTVLLAVPLVAAGCRRAETPAPTSTAAVATPTPAPTGTPAATAATPAPSPSAAPRPGATAAPSGAAALLNPAQATSRAPDLFRARFETTKGPFVIEVHREWAARGADRFYSLVRAGYFDDVAFFRVISGFMVQFGINGDPRVNAAWQGARIPDDPVRQSNTRGMVTFATSGPNSRTTQVFINFADNSRLDGMGFAPFGRVVEGLPVVDSLYAGYGEGAPSGAGPSQGRIQSEGSTYLRAEFPKLDYVKTARLVKGSGAS